MARRRKADPDDEGANPLEMDPLTALELVLDAARLADTSNLPEITQMRIKSAITQTQDRITNAKIKAHADG